MPSLFLTAALVGAALLHGAEPTADAPVTKEAAPVEAPAAPAETPAAPAAQPGDTAPLPAMDLPATTVQGDPAPPQTSTSTSTDVTDAAPAEGGKADASAAPVAEEMIRPTEKQNQSGKKVAAFWFITTGK
jgi:hypothetical protein